MAMLELFSEIDWTEYTDLFTYGNPPVYMQLLYFNVGVFILYILALLFSKKPQPKRTKLFLKLAYFAVNIAIIGQQQLGLDIYVEQLLS